MGKATGFKEFARVTLPEEPAGQRIAHWRELTTSLPVLELERQGARCMDCGVPFCQSDWGCPLDNLIPEWNELVHRGDWRAALDQLHATNNFPEFTGRVCPAPCESACVLGIHDEPVAIRTVEQAIADCGFDEGWIEPRPAHTRTGRRVAIVGSGPAGLAAAQQLARNGHEVVVYERSDRIGGLLMYGIPSPKLDKNVVDRRVQQLESEGVTFRTGVNVGQDVDLATLRCDADAVLLATGATVARDLAVPGRDLRGIHFAMDYLTAATRSHLDRAGADPGALSARGRHVVVVGGGDTGSDCIATAVRQGAASVTNLVILEQPPAERTPDTPWPEWPYIFRVDYAHEEASAAYGHDPRSYNVRVSGFVDDGSGRVLGLRTVRVQPGPRRGARFVEDSPGTESTWPADLVLIAVGFVGPEPLVTELVPNMSFERIAPGAFATRAPGVFVAGDCRRGQSLVVWAIAEGRGAAAEIEAWLEREESPPDTASFRARSRQVGHTNRDAHERGAACSRDEP